MPKKVIEQKPILPSTQELFTLNQYLAVSVSLQKQIEILTDFLNKHFKGKSHIILRSPNKSITRSQSQEHFPFNPDDIFLNEFSGTQQVFNENHHAFAVTKLKNGKELFGLIIIERDHPIDKPFLDSLDQVANMTGFPIYASIQKQLNQWRQKQLDLVRSVSEKISQTTKIDLLSEQFTRLVQETFNFYYVAIFIINDETKKLKFKASACTGDNHRPEFELKDHPGFALGEHMIGYVADTGRELIANNVNEEPRYKEVDSLINTKSEAVFPLKVESRIFGVFDVQSDELNAFDEDVLLVLHALVNSISLAVESTHLFQGLQNRANQLSIVGQVSRAITYILDIDELILKIVSIIHDRFDFPFVHLYTIDPLQEKIIFKSGSGSRAQIYEKANAAFDVHSPVGILPWVAQHNETKRINDVSKEPLFLESPFSSEISGSEMSIPLTFAGNILGILDIQSNHKNAFSQEDQQLMETLADNIAIAIRNARLYRSENWRRKVAESMRDVAGLLSEHIALDDVLESILVQLHMNLPCDIAGIWLFNGDKDLDDIAIEDRELQLAAYKTSESYPSEELGSIYFFPDNWVKSAFEEKTPTIRKPGDTIGPIAKKFNLADNYSSICAPMHIGDEILGMLTLVHHTPGRYGGESRNITSVFASYAAIAIKNTRLFSTSQEQAWISTILLQVAQATQSLTNIDELVATIVRLTPMVVGVKGCALFLREPETGIFSLYSLYGIGESSVDLDLDKPLPLINAPILDELAANQEPIYVHNPKEDFNLPDLYTHQMEEDTLLLLPLTSRNEVLGAFLLANESSIFTHNDQLDVFSEERLRIIQGIIQQTAVAVENIRLLEEKQEEAYVSTVLLQSAQAVVNSENLEDTLDSLVKIMPILVGIESSVIYIWDNEGYFNSSHAVSKGKSAQEGLLDTKYQPGDFPMLDTVFKNNRPAVFPFTENVLPPEDWDLVVPDEGQIDPMVIVRSRYPLLMGFPLSMQDDMFGVLLASDTNTSINRERRFELIWGIAQQASLAIQNDIINKDLFERQRLEREFQLARDIQQTFLPDKVPNIPGWQIDVRWQTARQVGGDFYDYFLLPDGHLGFVIADVSDKGLAASLYMSVTRTLIRAAAPENGSPARTLERVNDLLLANSQDGLFVTTFYGVLDLDEGTLTYSIAGHNPPMISRYDEQTVEILGKGGIALGALPDIHLDEQKTTLYAGDCLVMYTDGVTEAFNANEEMFGEERLEKNLEMTVGKGASELIEALEKDLDTFRGSTPLSDDTTILAICKQLSLANNHRNAGPSQDTINGASK